jgi:hypothetical protein
VLASALLALGLGTSAARPAATHTPDLTVQSQLLLTELAAGNGPDLMTIGAGSGGATSVITLAKAGYLAPRSTSRGRSGRCRL